MTTANIKKLKKEIAELERQLESNPFGGLFDRSRIDQLHRKLKKKRKELAGLEKADTGAAKKNSSAGKASPRGDSAAQKKKS